MQTFQERLQGENSLPHYRLYLICKSTLNEIALLGEDLFSGFICLILTVSFLFLRNHFGTRSAFLHNKLNIKGFTY